MKSHEVKIPDGTRDVAIFCSEHRELLKSLKAHPQPMSSSRNTLLCRIATRPPIVYRPLQRRWARVHDVRCLATHGNGDRIVDRYRDKLDRKARE